MCFYVKCNKTGFFMAYKDNPTHKHDFQFISKDSENASAIVWFMTIGVSLQALKHFDDVKIVSSLL
jgi:hypothetical protein